MKRIMCSPVALMALISIALLCCVPNLHASDPCSDATFKGSYGVTLTGTFVGVGPVAAVGQLSADGEGTATGTETISINGSISRTTFTAAYHVNPDCTGSVTVNLKGGGTAHLDFVMVDNGREQDAVQTDSGTVVTSILKRIHDKPEEQE